MNKKFWDGFSKQAEFKTKTLSDMLYKLSRNIPIKMKGFSGKSLKRTAMGKKL